MESAPPNGPNPQQTDQSDPDGPVTEEGTYITVAEIERKQYELFDSAAFERYKQSINNFGLKLFVEARESALQRDPDAREIEITTPDVAAATVRTEVKLARLRRLRFPYRLVQ